MNLEESKKVHDSITALLAAGRMDEGQALLNGLGDGLPSHLRLECQGNINFYRRELQKAIHNYEAAIEIAPGHQIARYHYLVGIQEEKGQNFVEAFKRYQAAIEAEPNFVDAYVELGALLVKVDDLEGAAKCYQDAVRLAPDDIANLYNLKAVLNKLAANEPDKWQDYLLVAERTYDLAVKRGQILPKNRQW